MSASSSWASGHLRELDVSECLELAATKSVGRIAVCTDDGPVVLPVNFLVDDLGVVFRTSPHNSIAPFVHGGRAAFEIDEVDDFTQSGWSVLISGTADVVDEAGALPAEARPLPWAEGVRSMYVRIAARSVTGRRLYPT